VLVTDFGIARLTDSATATMVGAGTPAYMAPEQVKGLDPVPQTDIYALGVMLFEMLTGGERPFTGDQTTTTGTTSAKVRWEQVNLPPPILSKYNPQISSDLDNIVLKCLAKKTEERFQTPLEVLNALELAAGDKKVEKNQVIEQETQLKTGSPQLQKPVPGDDRIPDVPADDSKLTTCPSCGCKNLGNSKYCNECGVDISRVEGSELTQKDKDHGPSNQVNTYFAKSDIGIFSLIWAASMGLSILLNWFLGLRFEITIGGVLGGLATGLFLKRKHIIDEWKSFWWIVLGWVFGMGIFFMLQYIGFYYMRMQSYFTCAIGGAIGGLGICMALKEKYTIEGFLAYTWIPLSWSLGLFISSLIGDIFPSSVLFGVIRGIVIGVISGLGTAIYLNARHTSKEWKPFFWIPLGWAFGMMIPILLVVYLDAPDSIFILGSGLIGLVIGLVLKSKFKLDGWKSISWIVLSWIVGMGILMVIPIPFYSMGSAVIKCTLGGAIGGLGTSLVLQKERIITGTNQILWIVIGWSGCAGLFVLLHRAFDAPIFNLFVLSLQESLIINFFLIGLFGGFIGVLFMLYQFYADPETKKDKQ